MSRTKEDKPKVELTDLTGISRNADTQRTVVSIEDTYGDRVEWLRLGASNLHSLMDRKDGRWQLDARMGQGATDFEEDAAYVLKLPLIGLTFESTFNQVTTFIAWVNPDVEVGPHSDFAVPRPGYNPIEHPKTHTCKSKSCEPHPIIPEEFYVPPFDADLYEQVKGKRVRISIGIVYKD